MEPLHDKRFTLLHARPASLGSKISVCLEDDSATLHVLTPEKLQNCLTVREDVGTTSQDDPGTMVFDVKACKYRRSTPPSCRPVDGIVQWCGATDTVTFLPASPLKPGTTYNVSFDGSQIAAGESNGFYFWQDTHTWTFTTKTIDCHHKNIGLFVECPESGKRERFFYAGGADFQAFVEALGKKLGYGEPVLNFFQVQVVAGRARERVFGVVGQTREMVGDIQDLQDIQELQDGDTIRLQLL